MIPDSARDFYDGLAADYHLMFRDWWTSARDQGDLIDKLIRSWGTSPSVAVLDCTCGIGTQALPLTQRGYDVTGADISERAIERARREADARDIDIELVLSDVRRVHEEVRREFDVVISFDNSLPHLLSDDDLTAGLASIRQCLRPGGLFLASTRDYDAMVRDSVRGVTPVLLDAQGTRLIAGQAWDWAEDRRAMTIYLFMLKQRGSNWATEMRTTTYRALQRDEMAEALVRCGFVDVKWHGSADTGYFQPVVSARAGALAGPQGIDRQGAGESLQPGQPAA